MGSAGDMLRRSFLLGYGSGAGHSAWRATSKNLSMIAVVVFVLTLVVAPLVFLYMTAKAITEKQETLKIKLSRLIGFGFATCLSAYYLGWILFFTAALAGSIIHPTKVPGYNWVPERVSLAVYQNSMMSLMRTSVIIHKIFDDKVPFKENIDPPSAADGQATIDVSNLVARIYAFIFIGGIVSGLQQRSSVNREMAVLAHNEAFMIKNDLDVSSDGILIDSEGNTFRPENRSQNRVELVALHRRNMRGYIDMDKDGRMTEWSGLVRRGTA